MNKIEASAIAERELEPYRVLNYSEIVQKVGTQGSFKRTSVDGEPYQVEMDFFYDSEEGGPVRVCAAVSYSGWTDFLPVSSDFIKGPNDEFVGE